MPTPVNLSGRGGRRKRRYTPMNEINVTPFVDVMLVLLVIFMVSAPLMTVGVPVDLPETAAKPLETNAAPLTVTVDAQGRVFLQENAIPVEELAAKLKAIAKNGYDERIFVRGDRGVQYGAVMSVFGRLSEAGFRRIGLVTDDKAGGA